ncbi:MAG: chloramphenicol acetyltransferase [Candidatus Riflebacteria bacterium]|nr:chloramphenicol acetyltransferase [Candidatus Riflebacteria bacterium]
MKRTIEMENWNRKEHFDFFSQFEEPFFGIVVNIDCTKTYHSAKSEKTSFFLKYLHKILTAVNKVEEFKLRIEPEGVFCYDTIHVSSTIGRSDGTFAFSFMEYKADFNDFAAGAVDEINRVKNSSGIRFNESAKRLDTIHFSSVPWVQFTALTHPRNFGSKDSSPKITVGKIFNENEKIMMPLSIFAHHGLIDGYHIGKLIELSQKLMDE